LGDEDVLDLEIPVDNAVFVAVFQRTANLTSKLPRYPFPQSSVTDDVVQHLSSVDVFENHIVVMLVDDHFPHAANIRMM